MSLPVRFQLRGNKRAPVTPYFLRLSLKRLGQVTVRHRMLADLFGGFGAVLSKAARLMNSAVFVRFLSMVIRLGEKLFL